MLDPARIAEIRSKLHANGCYSWTSGTFQNQLLSFIELNARRGDFVIEVGCARGGLTSQLSDLTNALGKELYVVDIDQSMLDQAAAAVRESTGSIPDSTRFFRESLKSFLARPRRSQRCILACIDGDHRYDGVTADIRALVLSRLARPLSVAFHDYALRSKDELLPDILVDKAIRDVLGDEILIPLGELAGLSSLSTEPSAETYQAYYDKGGSEGVLVTLGPGLLKRIAALRGSKRLHALGRRLGLHSGTELRPGRAQRAGDAALYVESAGRARRT
jgi:Methyltransferase domain